MKADKTTPRARTSASLRALVNEELRATRTGEAGASMQSVELGSATYTKMLGKRN